MNSKLKQLLSGELDAYKSIPFWSWNNCLDPEELVRQIEDMKEAGIGGFIMHARTGLSDEYLGEKWFHCIEVCLDKAKELGMQAWIYDENGWPSGFVGGKLLENEAYRARYLEYCVGEFASSAFAVFVQDAEKGFRRVTQAEQGVGEYHNIFLRISPANTDILNPAVVDAFIAETHEQYYARFADRFGRELSGFFTDEPQFYRWATPYTPTAEGAFEAEGIDIRDGLIWLFVDDERGFAFRLKYYETLNRLYVTNFYEKIYRWCQDHNCLLTGHSIEEAALFAQMWGGGAVMPTYVWEDIPAIDSLGRNCVPELGVRQVASVAAQMGKKRILTETFACAGYDVTPKELRGIAESQYFQGVNMMCQHLYPYSIAGQGRIDHPPVFSRHSNWFRQMRVFNDYFTRLGAIVANTRERVDIAIVHPMREIWLHYTRRGELESVRRQEESFLSLLEQLRRRGVTYHLLDEKILADHGSLEGDCLRVGQCVYDAVLIPEMQNISASTYQLLQNYSGRLCVCGQLRYIDGVPADTVLKETVTLQEILENTAVIFRCADGNSFLAARSGEIGDFLLIKNNSMTEASHVILEQVAQHYVALDIETLTERPIGNKLHLGPNESIILLRSDAARPVCWNESVQDITEHFAVTEITENYLVLDYAQLSREGGSFGPRKPIVQLFEELLREDYNGNIALRQTFRVADKFPLQLIMEKGDFLDVTVNGMPVRFTQSTFDVNFVEADISDALIQGENELTWSIHFWQHEGVRFALFDPLATESLRNCLYYDTSIEPAYLKGYFVVNGDHSLSKPRNLPAVTEPLDRQGYPFFKGALTLKGQVYWDGQPNTSLQIDGRYLVAEVNINGNPADFVLDNRKDITAYLQQGENEITIVLRSSLRNLFGPHHFRCDGDLMGVSPGNFHFRGQWAEGVPSDYTHDYVTVPFGLKQIQFITSQEE